MGKNNPLNAAKAWLKGWKRDYEQEKIDTEKSGAWVRVWRKGGITFRVGPNIGRRGITSSWKQFGVSILGSTIAFIVEIIIITSIINLVNYLLSVVGK